MTLPPDLPSAGWYPQTGTENIERYWDGAQWTEQTRTAASQSTVLTSSPPVPGAPVLPGSVPSTGFALSALIVGIVALLVGLVPVLGALVGIAAVILGAIALRRRQSKGMAVAAVVLGGIGALASLGITFGIGAAINGASPKEPVAAVVESEVAEPLATSTPIETGAPTPDAPVQTQSAPPAPAEPALPAAPAVPIEYTSALLKAASYSDLMHMSKAGIFDQLTSEYGEQFSAEAAQYAVDNVSADWNANAVAKAKEYQNQMAMSPEAIRDQLTSDYGEKFTPEEADFAIVHLND